ncbi:MAG: hypothetical protein RLZZ144_815 [Pseudomonadota bacterium]|jgi:arsenate reductase
MTLKLYGIPNCDTVKKARAWLTANGHSYEFHDFKKLPVNEAQLRDWQQQIGWEKIFKKTGRSWNELSPDTKSSLIDAESALILMQQNCNFIKRPVLEKIGKILVTGFKEIDYQLLNL